jgi:hypothetical protein
VDGGAWQNRSLLPFSDMTIKQMGREIIFGGRHSAQAKINRPVQ